MYEAQDSICEPRCNPAIACGGNPCLRSVGCSCCAVCWNDPTLCCTSSGCVDRCGGSGGPCCAAEGKFCCTGGSGTTCCNPGVEKCCDGQCYNKETHGCCNGQIYNLATQGCCNGQLYNLATECCVNGSIQPKCGSECYDPATQRCCEDIHGDHYICDIDEECCYNELLGIHYCVLPCRDEITDTTSCSKNNEPGYNGCHGCQQLTPPTCNGTYRDYQGLQIKTCYDGCPSTDWNRSPEDCYIVKRCFAMPHYNSWCLECEGEISCMPVIDPPPPGGDDCLTEGRCAAEVICDRATVCFQCDKGDEVADRYKVETCSCK